MGAVLGSKEYKDIYCQEKVTTWKSELETLALIAETEPQSAYAAYTKAYRSNSPFLSERLKILRSTLHQLTPFYLKPFYLPYLQKLNL